MGTVTDGIGMGWKIVERWDGNAGVVDDETVR